MRPPEDLRIIYHVDINHVSIVKNELEFYSEFVDCGVKLVRDKEYWIEVVTKEGFMTFSKSHYNIEYIEYSEEIGNT